MVEFYEQLSFPEPPADEPEAEGPMVLFDPESVRSPKATQRERLEDYKLQVEVGLQQTTEGMLRMGAALYFAREEFPGDREFGRWCAKSFEGLSRETLGKYRKAAETFLFPSKPDSTRSLTTGQISQVPRTKLLEIATSSISDDAKYEITELVYDEGSKITAAEVRQLVKRVRELEADLTQKTVDEHLSEAQLEAMRKEVVQTVRTEITAECEAVVREREREMEAESEAAMQQLEAAYQAQIETLKAEDRALADRVKAYEAQVRQLNQDLEAAGRGPDRDALAAQLANTQAELKTAQSETRYASRRYDEAAKELRAAKRDLKKKERVMLQVNDRFYTDDDVEALFRKVDARLQQIRMTLVELKRMMASEEAEAFCTKSASVAFEAMVSTLIGVIRELPPSIQAQLFAKPIDNTIDITPDDDPSQR